VQSSIWDFDKVAREWYYHRFYKFQPDLNVENLDVRTEIQRIMGYWLELGLSGFRVDAVPFVIESRKPGEKHRHYEYLTEFRDFLQWREGDAILLGEANVVPEEDKNFFGPNGDRMHMMFNFFVNQHLFYAFAVCDVTELARALKLTQKIPSYAQWASFLRNHDELDLGRLTKQQRELVYQKFGPDKNMQLYGRGIRRRLAPMLGNRAQLEMAYSLMFALPGTPVLRYGDEIGMGDDLSLPERNSVRTPMQWSDELHGGFSTADETVLPVISEGPYSYQRVNVEAQRRDPTSMLNWIERLIRLRKECPEIGWGTFKVLSTGTPSALALKYEWRNNQLIVIHSFNARQTTVTIDPGSKEPIQLTNLMAGGHSYAEPNGKHKIVLQGYGYRWYRVGGLGHILRREKY
jgi:maltose alpha-D-glucosyltransferase/alpha-amylase